MAIKSKSRKQLLKQPDEFLSFSGKLLATVIQYKVHAVSGLGVILAVVLLASGIHYMGNRAENQAFSLLQKGLADYGRTLPGDGAKKAYESAAGSFQAVLKDYSGRDGGKLARIIYAGMAYDAGDFDAAIAHYKEALDAADAYPGLRPFLYSGLGRAYDAKKEYALAAKQFESVTQGADPVLKEDAYLNLGFIYDRMGNPEKSAETFKKFIADYPESAFLGMVKEKLANS
ncbi:tetratricopeptide repeat protein [Desulfococcus sp.]|uniref:tetratricopeptide repeat protein n=1 Tax=Desulfococcus sp. TaxID=2025834 RepID=UPI003593D98C